MTEYVDAIISHYEKQWGKVHSIERWTRGPIYELPDDFRVVTIAPSKKRNAWTYATAGMSQPGDPKPIELHLFSPEQTAAHVELLTALVHYHRTGARLGLGHTVNFGRPWLGASLCDHGLISLPYLDGPSLEMLTIDGSTVRCLWLLPITADERRFVMENGIDAFEERLEAAQVNYLDPNRKSLV